MKQANTLGTNGMLPSDKITKIMIKVILLCSIMVVGCEFYILNKL